MSDNDTKIYNSRILYNYIKLFRDKYPHVDVFDVLNYAGITIDQIEDPLEWFSQNQVNKFAEILRKYFDDPLSISREAGHYAYSDKDLGLWQKFTIEVLGIGYILKNATKYASAMTKNGIYTSRSLSSNKYEIKVTLHPWVKENPNQEANRLGILEAAPLLFSDKLAKVELLSEKNVKIYKIKWKKPLSDIFLLIFKFYLIAISAFSLIAPIFLGLNALKIAAIPALSLFLILLHLYWRNKYQEFESIQENQQRTADNIIQNYIDDYNQVLNLNRIGRIVLSSNIFDEFINQISEMLIDLKYKSVAFFATDFDSDFISYICGQGYNDAITKLRFRSSYINSNNKLSMYHFLADKITLKGSFPLDISNVFGEADFPLIYTPIVYEKSVMGYFFVTLDKNDSNVRQKKLDFLSGVAAHIALGIHKSMAYNELVDSDRMKSDFLSIASHELNTPIQIMMLAISEMSASDHAKDMIPIIKGELVKFRQVVKTFLDIKKTSKETLKRKIISIDALFEKIKQNINNSERFFSHKVNYLYSNKSSPVYCDLEKIITVILNLFNNACKYTPKNGHIAIVHAENESCHTLSVIDNGIGIPKDSQAKVFIRFYQCDRKAPDLVGGFGLGLSISQEIIKLHSGEISIISPLSGNEREYISARDNLPGTCMNVSLPKEKA